MASLPRVFDLELYLPADEHGKARRFPHKRPRAGNEGPDRLPELAGHGFSNYQRIFTARGGKEPKKQTLAEVVADMDADGIARGAILDSPHPIVAEAIRAYPDRFVGLALLSPHDGHRAARELERLVREDGFHGLYVAPLRSELPASDRRYYPLYTRCIDLGIPVRIYTAMSYATDRPYDLGHPRHLDQIASDLPELKILAGLGGWPWVADMVALLRRYPNLYCDVASHRPKHLATPGSGWEMFLQNGNTLLQDKIMIGLAADGIGMTSRELIDEFMALPLKDTVKEKWLYSNAARFFEKQ